jgi:microcystin-dependent protein
MDEEDGSRTFPAAPAPEDIVSPENSGIERRGLLKKALAVVAGGIALGTVFRPAEADTASVDPYLGEIMLFAGTYVPRGWAACNGQLLSIVQNQALFGLLGTRYGGNGVTTFALPDLRGRVPIHAGQGQGLSDRAVGDFGGAEAHTLTTAELPAHTHAALAHDGLGTSASPVGLLPAQDGSGVPHYGSGADAALASNAIGFAGGDQPHNNMQPYLTILYCISLQGPYPPQP